MPSPASGSGGTSRRQAAAALLTAAAGWQAARHPAWADDAASGPSSGSFYNDWPYLTPSDILPYLRATANPGDIDSVLSAIDRFAGFYPMYRCGPEKGAILESLVARQRPQLALELGTFMGYGAARISRQLPPGGRLITIEAGEEQAEVARQVLQLCGVETGEGPGARVQVVNGLSGDVLPRLRELAGTAAGLAAGLVFLDHCKPCYLPDLISMERLGLVQAGTVVVADNVLVPGAPDYLAHVGADAARARRSLVESDALDISLPLGTTPASGGAGAGDGGGSGCAYRTQLVGSMFEVEQRFKPDWQPQQDALSVSLCLQGLPGAA
ncbi:hypothetical protein D9Q98_006408 [Chlorella vulgaris]|uniref:catechol O-methyltransferase n=1 Tax=Chlorella vulgaris TaxID=3077 RepID=A0A9D4YV01_CHLVU|nr:hypothetical protein D9Q98_006408 [Chlorella vulgaris]